MKKLFIAILLGYCLLSNVYSIDGGNNISICRDEKLSGYEYQDSDLSVLKFENIKKLVFAKHGCFNNSKKLKKLIFENDNIDIFLPSGGKTIPTLLNPHKDLGLPLDCHVLLKENIEASENKLLKYRGFFEDSNFYDVVANFVCSLKNSVKKNSLDYEDINDFALEITFFVINECSQHNWYFYLSENSYSAISHLSEKCASYRNAIGSNTINGEFDMDIFYKSNEYKFALCIYEFLSTVSSFDSGNVYERTLNAIINATDDVYTQTMCTTLKDAYNFLDRLDSGIKYLEDQIREQELQKQKIYGQEMLQAIEQKRIKASERRARVEARRLAEREKRERQEASIAMNNMFKIVECIENREIDKTAAIQKFLRIMLRNSEILKGHYADRFELDANKLSINLEYYVVSLLKGSNTFCIRRTENHPAIAKFTAFCNELEKNNSSWFIMRVITFPVNFIKKFCYLYRALYDYFYDEEKYNLFLED